jgi:hypothetical protein
MIALVDAHIIAQLQRLKRGTVPVPVYGPGAARPKGKMTPPCYAVSQFMSPMLDMALSRPYLDDYEPSATQATVIYPNAFDENGDPITITGPDSWTHRKWPLPHKLFYQIDIIATDQDEAYGLYLGLSEALPLPYTFRIGSCAVKMIGVGTPANLNEVEKPLFRYAYSYKVSNVWTARSISETVPGIKSFDAQREITSDE